MHCSSLSRDVLIASLTMLSGVAVISPFIPFLSLSMSLRFASYTLDLGSPKESSHTLRGQKKVQATECLFIFEQRTRGVQQSIAPLLLKCLPLSQGLGCLKKKGVEENI